MFAIRLAPVVSLVAACLYSSCTTTNTAPRASTRPTYPKYAKPQPAAPKLPVAAQEPASTDVAVTVTEPEMQAFIAKHSADANSALSDQDYVLLQNVEDLPKPGSAAEAVVIIGTAKTLTSKAPAPAPQNYQEEVIEGGPANNTTSSEAGLPNAAVPSLQNLLTTRGINLSMAINANAAVKTPVVFELIQRALDVGNNTPDFVASVRAAMGGTPAPQGDTSTAVAPTTESSVPLTLSPADLRMGDAILMDAQKLASNKMFPEAIAKAQQIPAENAMHVIAQEKIKAFSNQAVQDLRQKAAQAFQSALPVADPKTRAVYLEQARTFLEQAINTYPTADQISTVKENLAVITRNLEQIGEDGGDQK